MMKTFYFNSDLKKCTESGSAAVYLYMELMLKKNQKHERQNKSFKMLVKAEAYLYCESCGWSSFGKACGLNWTLPSVVLSTFIIDLLSFFSFYAVGSLYENDFCICVNFPVVLFWFDCGLQTVAFWLYKSINILILTLSDLPLHTHVCYFT